MRNEIKRGMKVYFYDNGIRNSLISNFNLANTRTDIGHLWENFVVSERRKYLNNKRIYANTFFWRTLQGQEIDYIEEIDGKFTAYEIKWSKERPSKQIKSFIEGYKVDKINTINPDNIATYLI